MTFTEKILEQFKTSQNSEHFMNKLQEAEFRVYPVIKPEADKSEFVLVKGDDVAHVLCTGRLALKDQKVGIQILEKDIKTTNECEWFEKVGSYALVILLLPVLGSFFNGDA